MAMFFVAGLIAAVAALLILFLLCGNLVILVNCDPALKARIRKEVHEHGIETLGPED